MKDRVGIPPARSGLWPWALLFARTLLFALFQGLIAFVLALPGRQKPWDDAAAWWPIVAALGSLATLAILLAAFRREGLRYRDLLHIDRPTLRANAWVLVGFLVIAGPIGFLPSLWLGDWLFGSQQAALELLARPLPLWAALAAILVFPAAVALSELPTYLAYVQPRIERQLHNTWLTVAICALMLAAQHICLPFLPDWRFLVWRLGMFLPFALLLAVLVRWRKQLLPYLMIVHFLMDLATSATILMASL